MERDSVDCLPVFSGIYLFKNAEGVIMYIGKAKNLRDRVRSYFSKEQSDWKVVQLMQEAKSVEHILTHNEMEALLLEAQLIQAFKPKYNVLLKSGRPFTYIAITQEIVPRMVLMTRKQGAATFIGPFLRKGAIRKAYEYLLRTFRLALCKRTIAGGCLDYHLKRCAGSCMPTFDKESYLIRLKLAHQMLKGDFDDCYAFLKEHIQKHNQQLEFEKSHHLTEYLSNLRFIFDTLQARFSDTKYQSDITSIITPMPYKMQEAVRAHKALQQLLNLPKEPVTIDCFDISHFQSRSIVGSAIRFRSGLPDKQSFRRFKIKSIDQQDDYKALHEIVSRRYRDKADLPDIVLIDGGKGQLNAVKQLTQPVPCLSLAKKEERLFTPLHPEGITLSQSEAYARLLISLRDYAHHFALSYHKIDRLKKFIR